MAKKRSESKPNATRSDRRMVRNRRALLDAVERLSAEKGLERVTIDEIAEAADLSKGTFYTYFNHKNEIAEELAQIIRRGIRDEVAAAVRDIDDSAGQVIAGIGVCLRAAAVSPARAAVLARMYSLWMTTKSNREFLLFDFLDSGYRTGRFSIADYQVAIVLIVGVVQAGITRALQLAEWNSIHALASALSEAVLRSLGLRGSEAHAIAARVNDQVFARTPQPGTARGL